VRESGLGPSAVDAVSGQAGRALERHERAHGRQPERAVGVAGEWPAEASANCSRFTAAPLEPCLRMPAGSETGEPDTPFLADDAAGVFPPAREEDGGDELSLLNAPETASASSTSASAPAANAITRAAGTPDDQVPPPPR
jgi:hypothetical protein